MQSFRIIIFCKIISRKPESEERTLVMCENRWYHNYSWPIYSIDIKSEIVLHEIN